MQRPEPSPNVLIRCLLTFLLAGQAWVLFSQDSPWREIEGRVLDAATREPVPYANVYNKTLQKGTITNPDGYFRLMIGSAHDSIAVIFLGYTIQMIPLEAGKSSYTVLLEESQQLLREIVVRPKDDSYLYKLLAQCRDNPGDKGQSKVYYMLKTVAGQKQIELVEGYYNATVSGYELTDLKLKEGRLALQPFDDRLFGSFESSRAITMMKWTHADAFFPTSPLDLTRADLKKGFELQLDKKYLDPQQDSVYVISFMPRDTSGLYFSGSIWINTSKDYVAKILLTSPHSLRHPFRPAFHTDTISNVSFKITKTFTEHDGKVLFNHIDFTYGVRYRSRVGEAFEKTYTVETQAVLYAYDYSHTFDILGYVDHLQAYNDYRVINAMPYNSFFWSFNDEYGLSEDRRANDAFFSDPSAITNKTLFNANRIFRKGLFEAPFIQWSEDRIQLKPMKPDSVSGNGYTEPVSPDSFQLVVRLWADINTYRDSTHILTAAILDPYKSYDYLDINPAAQCFINLYFDLCETERKKLDEELKASIPSRYSWSALYAASEVRLNKLSAQFFKETDHGRHEANMRKWNTFIVEQLGIDNIALFKPFGGKE